MSIQTQAISEARTQAEELIEEAREWPRDGINEGRLINSLADVIETLLAALPETPTTDDRLREAADRMSPLSSKPYTSLDLALVRDAAYQVAAGFRRPSPPTEELLREAGDRWPTDHRELNPISRAMNEARQQGWSAALEAAARVGGEA